MKKGIDYIGIGVGILIFNERGDLFLMKRGKNVRNESGHWDIPGGSVEFNEGLRDAAIREVKEEIGVDIEIVKQLPAIDHLLPEEKQHWVTSGFVARIQGTGKPENLEPDKCEDIGWFSLQKLPNPLTVSTQKHIENYKQNYK